MPVAKVGLPVADPGVVVPGEVRSSLGLPVEAVVLMHLGFLTKDKGLRQTLAAVVGAVRAGAPVHLVLVGEGDYLGTVDSMVCSLGLESRVTATGWQPEEVFPRLPAAADLGVVLRNPSAGETSAAVVRFLACGTPVAASAYPQFLEWPEQAVPRVTPGPGASAELARLLITSAAERGTSAWSKRREVARATYERMHRPACTAEAMLEFLAALAAAD
jgi:glycosyltransferase involved in cell wall biosynthesis